MTQVRSCVGAPIEARYGFLASLIFARLAGARVREKGEADAATEAEDALGACRGRSGRLLLRCGQGLRGLRTRGEFSRKLENLPPKLGLLAVYGPVSDYRRQTY